MKARLIASGLALACALSGTAFAKIVASAYTISTVAGNGSNGSPVDGSIATAAPLNGPTAIAPIPGGGFYIGDWNNVRKVDASGRITTVAGGILNQTSDFALAPDGTLYIADSDHHVVKKLANGVVSVVAGGGSGTADGIPATSALLDFPTGLELDASGNLYISEFRGCRIRMVDVRGNIRTLAGNGSCTSSGDNGPATQAGFNQPWGLRFDADGNLLVVETAGGKVRKIAPGGTVTTVASGLARPVNIDVDAAGNAYVAEYDAYRIRRIAPGGVLSTVAGTGSPGFSGDGGPANGATMAQPYAAIVIAGGYFIPTRADNRVRFVADPTIQPLGAAPFTSCAAEGFSGPKLTLCQQICEVPQSPARLGVWIKKWLLAYRVDPPCGVL